ncbi:hypothetical protein KEM63_01305 [Halopseudomonas nanhaiensis]|uniref:hypothetical protein n=1 Tax=Halopseudomonas nanhaiensis TaxID=2830842 RepID=UPI001CBA6BC2|nr:hypothetical protein [Halopseudomonas nanhaiensis]UAW98651.1 hypothetical protein KEM63_01305 [Halopseudomonas nanhaiensis]
MPRGTTTIVLKGSAMDGRELRIFLTDRFWPEADGSIKRRIQTVLYSKSTVRFGGF